MDITALNNQVEKVIQHWIDQVLPKLKAQLDKKGIHSTGELQNSLRASFAQDANILSSKIILEYALQGKFQDLKRWNFSRQPPVDALKAWVLKEGLAKFPYIPGYETSNRTPTADRAAARIAWGIARRWDLRGKVTRRNQWGQLKIAYSEIPKLREQLALTVADQGLKMIKKSFENI